MANSQMKPTPSCAQRVKLGATISWTLIEAPSLGRIGGKASGRVSRAKHCTSGFQQLLIRFPKISEQLSSSMHILNPHAVVVIVAGRLLWTAVRTNLSSMAGQWRGSPK